MDAGQFTLRMDTWVQMASGTSRLLLALQSPGGGIGIPRDEYRALLQMHTCGIGIGQATSRTAFL